MKQFELPYSFMSAPEFARKSGLSYQETLAKCKDGTIDAFETDGGQWRVKVWKATETVPKKQYDELMRLYTQLETRVNVAMRTLAPAKGAGGEGVS
jgi:hypothetical protein